MWTWQRLDILDVLHGHVSDFAGAHPSIQRGRLDTTRFFKTDLDINVHPCSSIGPSANIRMSVYLSTSFALSVYII